MTLSHPISIDAVAFARNGFLAPVPILTRGQCVLVDRRAREMGHYGAGKDLATRDRFFFDVATRPALMALVETLLGKNAILWGVEILERAPGVVHQWHVDIECADPDEKFLSVWIGLGNTSRESALAVLSGSHRFGKTIQEVQYREGFERGAAAEETIAAWGREFDPAAAVVQPEMGDGDAVVFDGHIWHGSRNRRSEGTRTALLIQYAAADAPVRRVDANYLSWPIRVIEREKVPSILLGGKASGGNWLVNPPPAEPVAALHTVAHRLDALAEDSDEGRGWRMHRLFHGKTANLDLITCHASALSPGKSPHEPHSHLEEELLVVLDGEAELLISETASRADARAVRVEAGAFVYYPAYQFHTLRNSGDRPVTYLMLKWRGPPIEAVAPLATGIWKASDARQQSTGAFRQSVLFNQATAFLEKLHAHVSEVDSGGGYAAHRDEHDVALVLLSGTIESGGKSVSGSGIVFHPAGALHGLQNTGSDMARYLVFEFHGPALRRTLPRAPLSWHRTKKAARRQAGRARRLLRRIAGLG